MSNILKLKRTKEHDYQDKIKDLISFDDNNINDLLSDANHIQANFKAIREEGNIKIEMFFSEAYEDITIDCYLVTLTVLGVEYHEVSSLDTTFKSFVDALDFITCELLSPENKGLGLQIRMVDCDNATPEDMCKDDFTGSVSFMVGCELEVK